MLRRESDGYEVVWSGEKTDFSLCGAIERRGDVLAVADVRL